MKTNKVLMLFATLGSLMVSSCDKVPEDSVNSSSEGTSLTSGLGSYSYLDASDSRVTDVSHGRATQDKLEFVLNDDEKSYSVKAANKDIKGDIVIPTSYFDLPVTSISSWGFERCEIRSLYIPKGVKAIEDYAFYGCKTLKKLFIPETVNRIGTRAMHDCSNLAITVSDKNPCFSSLDGALYNKNKTKIIKAPGTIQSFAFPKTVTRIHEDAFQGCKNLKSIVIPEGITYIGENAFDDSGLIEVYISKTVVTIDNYAFSGCMYIKHVDFCYDGGSHESELCTIGRRAFFWCVNLEEVILPDHVTLIDDEAFSDCGKAKVLHLGNDLQTIGENAFVGMKSIEEVKIPRYVLSIAEDAFEDCTKLESIEVDKNNNYYASYDGVLYNKGKTSLMICPQGKALIDFPKSVVNFREFAFRKCALTYVEIPSTVKYIDHGLFYECESLTSVKLPKGISRINSSAFYGCSSLASFVVDSNIEEIGFNAFSHCSSLADLEFKEGVSEIDSSAFYDCTSLSTLTLPNSLRTIGDYGFEYCTSLTSVTFGTGLRKIDTRAFHGCSSLSSITYLGDMESWNKIEKTYYWNSGVPATYVQCNDGVVHLSNK